MAAEVSPGKRRPTSQEQIYIYLVSALLVILGVAALAAFAYSIYNNDEIKEARDPAYVGIGADIEKVEPIDPVSGELRLVLALEAGSRLEQMGLQNGDILLSVGGQAIDVDASREVALDLLAAQEVDRINADLYEDSALLTLLDDIEENLEDNALVSTADIEQLAVLGTDYAATNDLVEALRQNLAQPTDLQVLREEVQADLSQSTPTVADIRASIDPDIGEIETAEAAIIREDIAEQIAEAVAAGTETLTVEIIRNGESQSLDLDLPSADQFEVEIPLQLDASALGFDVVTSRIPQLVIRTPEDTIAAKTLQNGDLFVSLNNERFDIFELMAQAGVSLVDGEQAIGEAISPIIRSEIRRIFREADGAALPIEVYRNGETIEAELSVPQGLFVNIEPESFAAQVGIPSGSRIRSINEEPVTLSALMQSQNIDLGLDDEAVNDLLTDYLNTRILETFRSAEAGTTVAIDIENGSGAQSYALEVPDTQRIFLLVTEDSTAASIGLQDDDILLRFGDVNTADLLQFIEDSGLSLGQADLQSELQAYINTTFNDILANADGSVEIEVQRNGESFTVDLPLGNGDAQTLIDAGVRVRVAVFELDEIGLNFMPQPVSIEDLGLIVFAAELPYFQMLPQAGGPSASDIPAGSALVRIDETRVTPDMDIATVRALAEDDTPLDDEDFRIGIEFKRVNDDGGFQLIDDNRIVTKQVPPAVILSYFINFGVFVPILVLVLSIFIIYQGVRLPSLDMTTARWVNVILLWLMVGAIVVGFRDFWVAGSGGSFQTVEDQPFQWGEGIESFVPYLLLAIPLFIANYWLGLIIDEIFVGEESLTTRNTRFAWSLLVPTIAALLLVAARPLEQTFITSLTDRQLAGARPARYVGLEHYQTLMTFDFEVVQCKKPAPEDLFVEPISRSQLNLLRLYEFIGDNNSLPQTVRDDARTRINSIRSDEEQLEPDECLRLGNGNIEWESLSQESLDDGFSEATVIALPFGDDGLRILGKDAIFLKGVFNTLRFTLLSVTLELIIGMIIALVVNTKFAGRGIMRAAMLVPWAIPTVVGATLWGVLLRDNQSGILNVFLLDLGLIDSNEAWLSVSGPWLNSIVAIDVWKTSPFMALLLLAGLQTIPADIYEAADVDGASKLRQFFSITLPLLRPTIAIALIFRTLDALRVFDVFQVLLDPRTRPSMATHNFNVLIANQQAGYASAIGVIIFILILIITVIYVRFVGIEQR